MHMTIESAAFAGGQPIPKKYSGDGEDVSPPLAWKGVPAGKELRWSATIRMLPRPSPGSTG